MTREEAIARIKNHKIAHKMNESRAIYISEALDKAIEALEHEEYVDSVLDKMRDEIKGKYRVILKNTPKDDWAVKWNDCVDECLQIIDKYEIENEIHCNCTDKEIAKSFIDDVEIVKDLLPQPESESLENELENPFNDSRFGG